MAAERAAPPEPPSREQYRAAADRIRTAEFSRQVLDAARPRGVTGLTRSRLPLAWLIRLAAMERRLVWHSVDEFAILDAPMSYEDAERPSWTVRRWRMLDRTWDPVVAYVPAATALLLALVLVFAAVLGRAFRAELALQIGIAGAGILALVAAGYGLAVLCWSLLRGLGGLIRQVEGRVVGVPQLARGALVGQNWSIALCHLGDPARAGRLLSHAIARARELAGSPRMLLCPEAGITTAAARAAIAGSPLATRLRVDPGLLLVGEAESTRDEPARPPTADPHVPVGGLTLLLGATLLVVAVQAVTVAGTERAACGGGPCANRPAMYVDALVWLLRCLSIVGRWGGLPEATNQTHFYGVLDSVLGGVVLGCAVMAGWRYLRAQGRAVDEMNREMVRVTDAGRSRVLILTAAPVEHDAVQQHVLSTTGVAEPRAELVGPHAVWHLGRLGSVGILLSQSEQGTARPGGMTQTAAALIDRLRPRYVILTGICCGLRPGEQRLGDVIVCNALQVMDHRKIVDSAAGTPVDLSRGLRPAPSQALLGLCQIARAGWTRADVHIGLMLSGNVLVDSPHLVAQLRALEPDALGWEMEGTGVYASAHAANVQWIMVKAISDWGFRKTNETQRAAASNAADFVVRVIRGINQPAQRGS